jgi:NAD dependent epimerase/dehydratase family enzyme
VTAPEPVTNAAFATALGRALHRPSWLPAPAFALRLALGSEMADSLILGGQRVLPRAAVSGGFRFAHPDVDAALRAVYTARA